MCGSSEHGSRCANRCATLVCRFRQNQTGLVLFSRNYTSAPTVLRPPRSTSCLRSWGVGGNNCDPTPRGRCAFRVGPSEESIFRNFAEDVAHLVQDAAVRAPDMDALAHRTPGALHHSGDHPLNGVDNGEDRGPDEKCRPDRVLGKLLPVHPLGHLPEMGQPGGDKGVCRQFTGGNSKAAPGKQ